ncbi:MAG: hypothetical protein J6Y43_07710 [Clostridia bacterium]|nr:hypothetical protein [Clostridia bacterium]
MKGIKKRVKNTYRPAEKTVCRCPICNGKLKKEYVFVESDHRWGTPEPRELTFRAYPGAKKETQIEQPQGNGQKKLTVYRCSACHLGWKPKDVIRERIRPQALPEMTVVEYKEYINSPGYNERFLSVLG